MAEGLEHSATAVAAPDVTLPGEFHGLEAGDEGRAGKARIHFGEPAAAGAFELRDANVAAHLLLPAPVGAVGTPFVHLDAGEVKLSDTQVTESGDAIRAMTELAQHPDLDVDHLEELGERAQHAYENRGGWSKFRDAFSFLLGASDATRAMRGFEATQAKEIDGAKVIGRYEKILGRPLTAEQRSDIRWVVRDIPGLKVAFDGYLDAVEAKDEARIGNLYAEVMNPIAGSMEHMAVYSRTLTTIDTDARGTIKASNIQFVTDGLFSLDTEMGTGASAGRAEAENLIEGIFNGEEPGELDSASTDWGLVSEADGAALIGRAREERGKPPYSRFSHVRISGEDYLISTQANPETTLLDWGKNRSENRAFKVVWDLKQVGVDSTIVPSDGAPLTLDLSEELGALTFEQGKALAHETAILGGQGRRAELDAIVSDEEGARDEFLLGQGFTGEQKQKIAEKMLVFLTGLENFAER